MSFNVTSKTTAEMAANALYTKLGFKTELLNLNDTELGGIKEVTFTVIGNGVYSRFKFESGVHRVQRIPVTESNGRIQTSTVTVAVLPEADDVEVDINPADLQIDTFRSSGAGGQHVNKTESAVHMVHLPTGIDTMCVVVSEKELAGKRDQVIDRIRALDYLDQTVFISFCWENLVTVRELLPEQSVQFLFGSFTEELIRQIIDNRFDVDVYHKSLTKELVDRFHAAGRTVNVWTVDKLEDAEKYASWGVDYITTNILE